MPTPTKPRQSSAKPVVLGPGQFMFFDEDFPLDDEGLPEPRFSVQETAKTFFGRSSDWLRWRYRPDKPRKGQESNFPDGYFVLDGKRLDPKVSAKGARYYTLADIERMAYALVQTGVLDGDGLDNVLSIVRANAALHGIKSTEADR